MVSHLDLMSGIGGFALAARWLGLDTIGFCEIDPWCQRVLAKNFPGVPIHDDLKTLTAATVRDWLGGANAEAGATLAPPSGHRRQQVARGAHGNEGPDAGRSSRNGHQPPSRGESRDRTLDLITAGYPCQPFSAAGKRLGAADDRHLWPDVRRLLAELRPRYFLGENVAGHLSRALDAVLCAL